MEFEFDPAKSLSNKDKHGIDFEEAERIWQDDNRLELSVLTTAEPRLLMVGVIDGRHWTAVITYRLGRVRIISVRRAVTWR